MADTDLELVIDTIRRHVRERYILRADAVVIADDLDGLAGSLAGRTDEDVASGLTQRLQHRTRDRHLRVRHRPEGAASDFGGSEHMARYASEAARNAGGINAVQILDGGVGLLRIAPYLSPVQFAAPYVRAAFTLLANVPALVIDLRAGLGGTPETVALICGYLLGDEPVHLQDIDERGMPLRQYWTAPEPARIDGPVRVLTSAATFSGCEELAYDLQSLGRAVVVGETTGGGAHPVEAFAVGPTLELHVPVARSVNAVTDTNWEQVGVVPERSCPQEQALHVALDDLAASFTRPG